MTHKLLFLTLCLLGICSACVETPAEGKLVEDKPFFDLKGYFVEEMNRLQDKRDFTKITVYNGEREEKKAVTVDLQKELQIFSNADINRTAWLDKYRADTTFNDRKNILIIEYKALEPDLKTRSLRVEFSESSVSRIEIVTAGKSIVSQTQNILTYSPARGYGIRSMQDIILLTENDMETEVLF